MNVDYTTRVEGGTIHVTIELPSGGVVEHSVPLEVVESESDPRAHLERIIARVARQHAESPGRPDWLLDQGGVDTDSPGQGQEEMRGE